MTYRAALIEYRVALMEYKEAWTENQDAKKRSHRDTDLAKRYNIAHVSDECQSNEHNQVGQGDHDTGERDLPPVLESQAKGRPARSPRENEKR